MRIALRRAALGLAATLPMLVACGDDDEATGTLTVYFDYEVAGQQLVFDDQSYTNAAGNSYTVTHLEYIVSDVDLMRDDGATFRLRDEHYRDAARSSTASFTAEGVPGGQHVALRFTFGVAGDRTLPNTADFNNMEWPAAMGGGYHYMRLEGLYGQGDESLALLSHTGPAGGADFTFVVELPLSQNVDGDDVEIHVVMDLNEWYEGPHVYDFSGQGMIMGNADAQLAHQANGSSVFRLGSVGDAREKSGEIPDDGDGDGGTGDDEDDGHDHDHDE